MDNCPHQVVLVGDAEAAGRAREIALGGDHVRGAAVRQGGAHAPLRTVRRGSARHLRARPRPRPRHAAVVVHDGGSLPDRAAAIRELLVEHWTSPVRFRETIEALYADGARVFLESGPRGNMTSFIEDILRGQPVCAVAADVRRRSGVSQLNHLAAMLAAQHVAIDAGYLFESRQVASIDWRAPAAPAPGTDGPRIPLSTSWPMLRLSPEAVASPPAQPGPGGAAASPGGDTGSPGGEAGSPGGDAGSPRRRGQPAATGTRRGQPGGSGQPRRRRRSQRPPPTDSPARIYALRCSRGTSR